MNYLECIPLTLFDRITVWIIKIKRERKGSANKIKFIVSFIVLPIHLLPIHVLPIHLLPIYLLPIQSMFYKSSPLHSSPCFTTCRYNLIPGRMPPNMYFLFYLRTQILPIDSYVLKSKSAAFQSISLQFGQSDDIYLFEGPLLQNRVCEF